MMETVTINVGQHRAAFRYAQRHHTSVQEMVNKYLDTFVEEDPLEKELEKLPPEVRSLCGILEGLDGYRDPEDERFNYLMDKYK